MKKSVISIVTISYNQANFLEECIVSVKSQCYSNIQHIIVDPGSTDGSKDIINKYKDYFYEICFDDDEGPADGLNNGFNKATGDIYGFLNADDMLEKNSLDFIDTFFKENPDIDVMVGNSWVIDKKSLIKRKFVSDKVNLNRLAYGECIVSQASVFFRAKCFNSIGGFNKNNKIAWDTELFTEMLFDNRKFKNVNSVLSRFRVHEDAITGAGLYSDLRVQFMNYLFHKIKNRKMNKFDFLIKKMLRLIRKFENPTDTYERVFKGSIYSSTRKKL